jgi:hypothetical protein
MTFIRENLPDTRSYFEDEGLTLQGRGKWLTTACNFHGGSDSMRINTESGGWVCMACALKGGDVLSYHILAHGLCFIDAAKELGCWVDDGKPEHTRPKPLPASQAIQVLKFESVLTYIAAMNIARGVQLTDTDRARLLVASQRIQTIAGAY